MAAVPTPGGPCECCVATCHCQKEGEPKWPMPDVMCCTLTGYNLCRFVAGPALPSATPHQLFGADTTRLTGTRLRFQRSPAGESIPCQVWVIYPTNDLYTYTPCPEIQADVDAALDDYKQSCTTSGSIFATCLGNFAAALGISNYLWKYLYLRYHCCPFTNPDPPLSARPVFVYTPFIKASVESPTGNTVYSKMTAVSCRPFSFTMEFYLTGISSSSTVAGQMDCGGDFGPPPPECDQLILKADFVAGDCTTSGMMTPARRAAAEVAADAERERARAEKLRRSLALADSMPCPRRGAMESAPRDCCDEGGSVWKCSEFGRCTLTEQRGVELEDCLGCDVRPR